MRIGLLLIVVKEKPVKCMSDHQQCRVPYSIVIACPPAPNSCTLSMVGVCAIRAEYLSDDGYDMLSSDPNKKDKNNQVDLSETRNHKKIQMQLKNNEKEGRKHKEDYRKYQEKLAVEKKLMKMEKLEKQTLKKWKRTRKEKRKEERKRKQLQLKIQNVLDRLENDSIEANKHVSIKKRRGDNIDDNDVDLHANWKNYVYNKYGLTERSGSMEKKAALIRYVQEELLDQDAKGTEAPAIHDSVSALGSNAVVDSTAAPPVIAVGLHVSSASDAATAPVVAPAPESAAAPRAAYDAVVAPEAAAAVETSSVHWPGATTEDIYPYIFPYEPLFDFHNY